jgi:hypothetical protein
MRSEVGSQKSDNTVLRISVIIRLPTSDFRLQFSVYRGKVNEKMLPLPGWLSTAIWPPFFSRKSLHSFKPRPVPVSSSVPLVVKNISPNKWCRFSSLMPMPLSCTNISMEDVFSLAPTSTCPFCGVNLMALD